LCRLVCLRIRLSLFTGHPAPIDPCASRLSPCCAPGFSPRRRHAPICISPGITAATSAIQGKVRAHPWSQRACHHRRHLQFGLHAGVRHRADEQDLRNAARQPRLPQAYYDKAFTFGIKVTSAEGTSDLMSYYPDTVKDWIRRNGGLTTENEEDQERRGTLEDRRSLSGRFLISFKSILPP